ncbi:hypothetical protein HK096_000812, partial [Nowakowskiella sp. JEL0078]
MKLDGLPMDELFKQSNVHFLSSSRHIIPTEIGKWIFKDIRDGLGKGVVSIDGHDNQEIFVIGTVLTVLGDNPRSSELILHSVSCCCNLAIISPY